jgi:penicillin-binding protein 2
MSQYINNEQDTKEYLPRYKLLYALVSMTVVIFFIRLWYLQIINGTELRTFSEQNSIKETKIPAPRGIIYDRDGRTLVENLPGFQVTVSPQYISDLGAISAAIGEALNLPAATVSQMIQKSKRINGPFRPVVIKDNLSRVEIYNLAILNHDFPMIDIKDKVLRYYPLQKDGSQLFGYVGEISKRQLPILNEKFDGQFKFQQGDIIGKTGLEEYLDQWLRGKDGISVQQVDARGREALADTPSLLGKMAGIQPATPGHNVVLTIDKDIQEAGFNAFISNDRIGGAVAMKVNGEILAWISAPSFDPNEFSTGISMDLWSKLINDPDRPLKNKVIQDHNSPGSTFKPLMATAALTEGVVTPNTLISCPGVFRFGNRAYHDSVKNGHGNLVITQAIERSDNVFFYKMGIALGIDRMFKYCDALGIGHKTGVELGGEVAGLMPSAKWKKDTVGEEWQPGENLSVAIGQGFVLTTPLQMAVAYNAIGNYGKIVKPFVVKRIMTPDNKVVKEFEPTIVRDLSAPDAPVHIKKETFDTVREGMRLVVNGERGTAKASKLNFIEIAGKTGSSQVISFSSDQMFVKCETRNKYLRPHAWFIGYAPADKPEIAFGILSEHGCHGASAAPVAKAMVQAYVAKYHPDWLTREPVSAKKKKIAAPHAVDVQQEDE